MPIVEEPRPQPLRIIEDRAGSGGMSLNDSVYDRLLRERIIFLGQPVDDKIANQICAQLLLLSAEDSARDINLYINSPGGSVTAGMAIFDTIELIECDVATWAMGLAASMGQFLLSAGTKGKRYALPHARILMHQGSAGIGGTASDIKIQAEQWNLTKQEMAEITAEHTGQTVDQIIRTGTGTVGSPPTRRWTTASSTTSSAGPARCPEGWLRPRSRRGTRSQGSDHERALFTVLEVRAALLRRAHELWRQ
jgi:ATP-dependent Clp protease protease subunit